MSKTPSIQSILILSALLALGCAQKTTVPPSQIHDKKDSTPHQIVVMPFQRIGSAAAEQNTIMGCPICEESFITGDVTSNAEERLTQLFIENLDKTEVYSVIPLNQIVNVISAGSYENQKMTHFAKAIQVGKELGIDTVLVGFVFRYERREGHAYSVKKPSSVAFEVHLINTEEGKSVWEGSFNETQISLSENVLKLPTFLKRGSKWLTADELAEHGVKEILKKFPLLMKEK